jgi:hypothetical protein
MSPLQKLNTLDWSTCELKDPLVFRENGRQFVIRMLRRNKDGRVMARLEMDDDMVMRAFDQLPWNVQKQIEERLAK